MCDCSRFSAITHGSTWDLLDGQGWIIFQLIFVITVSLPEHRHKKTGSERCRLMIQVHREINQ
jgi:hypothetical protein